MRGSIERGLATDGSCPAVACAAHLRKRTRCGPTRVCRAVVRGVRDGGRRGERRPAAASSPRRPTARPGPWPRCSHHFARDATGHRERYRRLPARGRGDRRPAAARRASGQAGCQSEVGVAAAMAAGGFAAEQGGTNEHVLYAAERALEPHLGPRLRPRGGRIQQPASTRNAAAAAWPSTRRGTRCGCRTRRPSRSTRLAAMVERGATIAGRYKESSLGGIALNVVDC